MWITSWLDVFYRGPNGNNHNVSLKRTGGETWSVSDSELKLITSKELREGKRVMDGDMGGEEKCARSADEGEKGIPANTFVEVTKKGKAKAKALQARVLYRKGTNYCVQCEHGNLHFSAIHSI
jgi:hypothetical protein